MLILNFILVILTNFSLIFSYQITQKLNNNQGEEWKTETKFYGSFAYVDYIYNIPENTFGSFKIDCPSNYYILSGSCYNDKVIQQSGNRFTETSLECFYNYEGELNQYQMGLSAVCKQFQKPLIIDKNISVAQNIMFSEISCPFGSSVTGGSCYNKNFKQTKNLFTGQKIKNDIFACQTKFLYQEDIQIQAICQQSNIVKVVSNNLVNTWIYSDICPSGMKIIGGACYSENNQQQQIKGTWIGVNRNYYCEADPLMKYQKTVDIVCYIEN